MSEWLDFVEQTTRGKTRKVVIMNKSGEYLGLIKWNSHWRQYCFFVEWDHYFELILAKSCLDDISG
ncbi:hypothetical protein KGP36_07315, partial [Patescibacteria group bacterium]|nr:hypothetical protein [Patescibacteria group bacterium]